MLYVVATPIGNLADITLRALEVLKGVDVVAAEDTRHSGLLLKHFEIKKPFVSYHQHNEAARTAELVIMTHEARESSMQQALDAMRKLPVVQEIGSFLRVEEQ